MSEFGVRRSDEPFDFRRQASTYGVFRRDYSDALYAAIGAQAGEPAGRLAIDLGCGTGFVTASLARRGWRAVGIDFSAPMLAEARALGLPLLRARAEALGVRGGSAALLTCAMAFHWFAPRPALVEIARVLAPGGLVALVWRYPSDDAQTVAIIGEALRAVNPDIPAAVQSFVVHSPAPFEGSALEPLAPIRIASTLTWTPETFHGYAATVEWYRRLAGERHADFLAELRRRLDRAFDGPFDEPNDELLFLARRR